MNPETASLKRPNTVMGRALASRSLAIAATHGRYDKQGENILLDLTHSLSTLASEHVRQAAKDALRRGETHYTSRPGVPELRAAIAQRSTDAGFPATVDTVVVTNGASEAVYIALQATLQPGDRVLILGPVAPNILEMIRFIGAQAENNGTNVENQFIPLVDAITSSDATVLYLASPSPVTGIAIPMADLERLVGVAIKHEMKIILDRSLADCLYTDDQSRFDNSELGGKVITTGSFSSNYGLSGWRVGYFTAPPEDMAELRELKQAMSICTTAVSQFAALAALNGSDGWLKARARAFAIQRDAVIEKLRQGGLDVVQPDAFPPLLIDIHSINQDDQQVANILYKHGVIVDPGSRFGEGLTGFIRIELGTPEQILMEGIDQLIDLGKQDKP